jgi:hypothetical protein
MRVGDIQMYEKIMVDHYAGTVGLCGHTGQLDDACNITIGMRVQPGAGVCGACIIHWKRCQRTWNCDLVRDRELNR